jgi:pyrroline-5-carboxylate reductase
MNKILLVGCGHMGSALLKAWTLKTNYSFVVIDPNQYKRINNHFDSQVKAFKSLEYLDDFTLFDIIIFAIKPQISEQVLKNFSKNKYKKKNIFVSIIAGKKISFFNKYLPLPNQFIRVMPNMPAMINQGMSCLIANKNVSKINKNKIEFLFTKVGKTLWLKNELEMNKVTAISGSGPGYIFLLIDAFEKAALQLGLGKNVTKKLVHQTFFGTINLLYNEKDSARILANKIAIKGGTTEAGINQFKNKKILHNTFKKVVKAAYLRANKLGK